MGYDLYPMDTLALQTGVRAGSHRARVPDLLRARSVAGGRHPARAGRPAAGGTRHLVERGAFMSVQIGIIGGSGLYDMAELTDRDERLLSTPFGDPSGPYIVGTLRGKRVAFLARHGGGHRLSPSELNYPRQHLRVQAAGRRVDSLGQRGGHRCRSSIGPSTSSFRTSSSIGRWGASARSSAAASWRTSASRTRCASRCRRWRRKSPPALARASTRAAPTCAWKGRSSRRWPSRTCTGRGAPTSSA